MLAHLSARTGRSGLVRRTVFTAPSGSVREHLDALNKSHRFDTVLKLPAYDASFTVEAFRTMAFSYAHGLAELGIGKGDSIVSWTYETQHTMMLQFGASMLGAYVVYLNPQKCNAAEIDAALREHKSKLFVFDPKVQGQNRTEYLAYKLPKLIVAHEDIKVTQRDYPNLVGLATSSDDPSLDAASSHSLSALTSIHFDDHPDAATWARFAGEATDLAAVAFTGERLSQADLLARAAALRDEFGVRSTESFAHASPGHNGSVDSIAALTLPAVGTTVVVPPTKKLRWVTGPAVDVLAMDNVAAALLPDAAKVNAVKAFQAGEGKEFERSVNNGMHIFEAHKSFATLRGGILGSGETAQLNNASLRAGQ